MEDHESGRNGRSGIVWPVGGCCNWTSAVIVKKT